MEIPGDDTEMASSGDRTLYVRFQQSNDDEIADALDAIDRGERPDPHFEIVYHAPEDIHRVTRPKNLELLRAIVQHKPESIRETARLVDRDVRQVHRNLTELSDLHLIDLVEEGQAKRPRVWYTGIDIDLPLVSPTVFSDEVEA